MSFKFQTHVVYEQLLNFCKDIYDFTSKLPSYETTGLISQIRILAGNTIQDFSTGFIRTPQSDPIAALNRCITTLAKIATLIDLCALLGYTDATTHQKWSRSCDELAKRLYETQKTFIK